MVKHYTEIPERHIPWILKQKMFWVATAPLTSTGHVNVSPKGFENTFHIVNSRRVWYEDLSGSGIETISHIRENGRITVMFTAFEGAPNITRLYGKGSVYEFGTAEYDDLLPVDKRQPGSRAVIMVDIYHVSTSCGYSIPFYAYKNKRYTLHKMSVEKESVDIEAETKCGEVSEPPLPEKGLKGYWKRTNMKSLDGLPGIKESFTVMGRLQERKEKYDKEGERGSVVFDDRMWIGVVLGVVMSVVYVQLTERLP